MTRDPDLNSDRIGRDKSKTREVVTEPAPSPYEDDPGTTAPAKPAAPPEPDKTAPVAAKQPPDWH